MGSLTVFVSVLALVAGLWSDVAATPDIAPIRLAEGRLPNVAEDQDTSNGSSYIEMAYHEAVGIPEAARIRAAEEQGTGSSDGPAVMIVGGLASYRGEHPFAAGLVITLTTGSTSVCGGSLISNTKVLTAARCYWDGTNQAYSMLVVLGSVLLFSGGTRVAAPLITLHPSYTPSALANDIAVLTIPYVSSTSYIKPIALARVESAVGTDAQAMGFGRTSDSAPITTAASMRDVRVSVIDKSVCQQYYGVPITISMMCTSGQNGRNPCGGDQGGPLIVYNNNLLIGVISFGSTAGCSAGAPSGYMRVSYYYYWIIANM